MTRTRLRWVFGFLAVVPLVLLACGASSSTTAAGGGSDAGGQPTVSDGGVNLPPTPSMDASGGAGDGAASEAGDTPPDAADGGSTDGGAPAYSPTLVTTPIPAPAAKTWTWVPLDGALCRDGSGTGIGINVNPSSPNLLIYLEGGGSCFDALSCSGNRPSFAQTDFGNGPEHADTIFDRTLTTSPVADWNYIYVPYCTGDEHGGNAFGVPTPGVSGNQDFVGYVDIQLALARIVPTFPAVSHVLLTGSSAGGAGVLLTYALTQRMFGSVPVDALDDSGPPMSSPYLGDCLGAIWANTWRYDRTVLADCGSACAGAADQSIHILQNLAASNPQRRFGVLDSIGDGTISALYGYSTDSCAAYPATTPDQVTALSPATFAAGQMDERTQMMAYPNYGSFLFPGKQHTTLTNVNQMYTFATLTAGDGGVALTSWVGTLLDGSVSNVGP